MVAAEARNFLKILTSKDGVYFLHFIWDLTTCLSKVSRVFQDRMTTVGETELTAAKAVLEFLKSVYGHPFNPFILLIQSYLQMEEELSNRLRQLYSRKYRVQQISAHICDRGGGIDG